LKKKWEFWNFFGIFDLKFQILFNIPNGIHLEYYSKLVPFGIKFQNQMDSEIPGIVRFFMNPSVAKPWFHHGDEPP